jgi:soluble epoxide hydrolase / lipid-phosphate phosphatase
MRFDAPLSASTNGIEMEYFEQGEGPAVLLLHGFPELPFSWRNQVDPIAAAGFRVIVPSQRGYGGTDAPTDPASYSVKNLVADLTGLLDALEIERAVWFGHDWGSAPAWFSGVFAPDRVLGLGSICTPYAPLLGSRDLIEIYDELRGPNHYMRTFQEPGVAERILGADTERTFRSLLRGRGYTVEEFEAAPKEIRELPIGVFVGEPQLLGEPIVDDDELRVYVDTFERTGFAGGLNWYRALHQDFEEARDLDHSIGKPALMIGARDDWFFTRGATDGMRKYLPRLEKYVIDDAAHWVQQERPAQVNAILVPWLERSFG